MCKVVKNEPNQRSKSKKKSSVCFQQPCSKCLSQRFCQTQPLFSGFYGLVINNSSFYAVGWIPVWIPTLFFSLPVSQSHTLGNTHRHCFPFSIWPVVASLCCPCPLADSWQPLSQSWTHQGHVLITETKWRKPRVWGMMTRKSNHVFITSMCLSGPFKYLYLKSNIFMSINSFSSYFCLLT